MFGGMIRRGKGKWGLELNRGSNRILESREQKLENSCVMSQVPGCWKGWEDRWIGKVEDLRVKCLDFFRKSEQTNPCPGERLENGPWLVENGEWFIVNGSWLMVNSKWS
jgi:hypothetical protein